MPETSSSCQQVYWWPKYWQRAGLQSAICVRSESMHHGAAGLERLIRNRWSVENQCHHLLDPTIHEDHSQVRERTAAHNLTLLRELSTKVLKGSGLKGSICSFRKRCALGPALRTQAALPIFHGFGA